MIEALSSDLKTGLSSVENRLASSLTSVETRLESTQASVDATANSIHTLNEWKSGIDTQVSDLSSSVQALRKQVDRMVVGVGLSALGTPPTTAPGAVTPPAAPATTNAGTALQVIDSGQLGHGVLPDTRGQTAGAVAFPLSAPVTGDSPAVDAEVFEDALADTHEVLMSISKQALNGFRQAASEITKGREEASKDWWA
ncbi:hypothetical protein QYE76_022745 [Lolium multiflorum]|uniref:Uncharacterized protein n=1 Tax=Lolium multiflorum TaxID=4521 RepID=A0AAD8R8Y0_LOLMU|nr:hypothetical protein QYE76_022745 [Lolium multiflorum]